MKKMDNTQYNILIVDDDPYFRKTLIDILQMQGYKTNGAASGSTALQQFLNLYPDVALLDLHLPDMSGLDVMHEFKSHAPDTECIILTGNATTETAISAINLDAYGYVNKPCDVDHLLLMIHRAIEKKETLQVLRDSERRLKQAEKIVSLGHYEIDINRGKIIWSDGIYEILGLSPLSYIPKIETLYEFIHKDDLSRILSILQACIEHGTPLDVVYRIIRKDGAERLVHSFGRFEKNERAENTRFLGTLLDITEYKLLETMWQESEAKFRSLAEQSLLGVAILQDDEVKYANQAVADLHERQLEDIIGWHVVDFAKTIHPDDREFAIEQARKKQAGDIDVVTNYQYRLLTRTGELRWVNQSSQTILYEGRKADLVSVIDITEQKVLEKKARQAEILEVELEKEKELVALKQNILSTISHEFRTPLAVIQTSTDLLALYGNKITPQRADKALKSISRQVIKLNDMIDDLLSVARNQSGQIKFEPIEVDVESFCHNILEQIKYSSNNTHQFTFINRSPGLKANADGKLLQHILSNLITNAIKYSPADELITIELDRDNDSAIIRISDKGIGIPEADQPRLFEPFHRASNVGIVKGTGLGLSIVKQYVDVHGGWIKAQSSGIPGEGATFCVGLPLERETN